MSGWVAGAMVVGTVVNNRSAKKAADTQAQSAADANVSNSAASAAALAENRRQYDQNRADIMPVMERGNAAGNRLQELMGLGGNAGAGGYGSLMQQFNAQRMEQEPGYAFGLQQGQRGIDNSAAARGGYYSGAQLKAAGRYNSDYASTKYGDAYNRYNNDQTNTFNRLSGIAGSGQQATTQIGQQGAQMANSAGQTMTQNAFNNGQNTMGAANARASSYLSQGNALQNALNQGVSAWGDYKKNNTSAYGSSNFWSMPPPRPGDSNFMGPTL